MKIKGKTQLAESKLEQRLRKELSKRRGEYPKIAAAAGVDPSWLHSIMKNDYKNRDLGVRRVVAVLKALGVSVSVD